MSVLLFDQANGKTAEWVNLLIRLSEDWLYSMIWYSFSQKFNYCACIAILRFPASKNHTLCKNLLIENFQQKLY